MKGGRRRKGIGVAVQQSSLIPNYWSLKKKSDFKKKESIREEHANCSIKKSTYSQIADLGSVSGLKRKRKTPIQPKCSDCGLLGHRAKSRKCAQYEAAEQLEARRIADHRSEFVRKIGFHSAFWSERRGIMEEFNLDLFERERIVGAVDRMVESARDISFTSCLLDGVHTMRQIQEGLPLERRNLGYYIDLHRAVKGVDTNALLNDSAALLRQNIGVEDNQPLVRVDAPATPNWDKRDAPQNVLNEIAGRQAVSLALHVRRNLLPVAIRAISFQLAGLEFENFGVPDRPNHEVRNKLAKFIAKRFLQLQTRLPNAVPADGPLAAVADGAVIGLINEFRARFPAYVLPVPRVIPSEEFFLTGVQRSPHVFLPYYSFFNGILEDLGDGMVANPIPADDWPVKDHVTLTYVGDKLKKHLREDILTVNQFKKLKQKMTSVINSNCNARAPLLFAPLVLRAFEFRLRPLNGEERNYIVGKIVSTVEKIRDGRYRPQVFPISRGVKLCAVVPQHTFQRRYIGIDRKSLHALLLRSLPRNRCPTVLQLQIDLVAARWFWSLFDLTKVGVQDFQSLLNSNLLRFNFKVDTDGVAMSIHFTRPKLVLEEVEAQEPFLVDPFPPGFMARDDDHYEYVDPGQTRSFSAVDRFSDNPADPAVIKSASTGEWSAISGHDKTNANLSRKMNQNFRMHGARSVRTLQSELPPKKTARLER